MWYVRNTESGVVETWRIGTNYRLVSVLGCGSFGAVCKALDTDANRVVALKRVPDALTSLDTAKRVLREVVVLNRLDHPNIIKIFDIFHTPATQGARVMDPYTFTLIPLSVDLYMAFELAEGGDLYEIRGEMRAGEVRNLMKQLTSAIMYLHDEGVMHRDIKSANTLCGQNRMGGRVVKICDFGSARGTNDIMDDTESGETLDVEKELRRRKRARNAAGEVSSSFGVDGSSPQLAAARNSQFAQRDMLTTVVATPCYRAPEVIMSNGGYTGSMDVWALGCIFGELLQRQQQHALTPNLTIAPLFRFDDDPLNLLKLGTDETYTAVVDDVAKQGTQNRGDISGSTYEVSVKQKKKEQKTRRESRARARLDLFFNVVGTPSWRCVEGIQNPKFRAYLKGIRGRPGSLTNTFAGCDDSAKDLLLRMLAFDPDERASPREILAHEYFADDDTASSSGNRESSSATGIGVPRVSTSLMDVEDRFDVENNNVQDALRDDFAEPFEMDIEQKGFDKEFWQLGSPRAALAALETAFVEANSAANAADGNPTTWRNYFKDWFERECERRTRSGHEADGSGEAEPSREKSPPLFDFPMDADAANITSFGSFEDPTLPGRLTNAFPLFFRQGEKPVQWAGLDAVGTRGGGGDSNVLNATNDTHAQNVMALNIEQRYLGGAFGTTGVFGQGGVGESSARDFGRLGDARLAVQTRWGGALGHLGANRHGEWGEEDLPTAMKKLNVETSSWGVTAVPPGMTKEEGASYASNQQGR